MEIDMAENLQAIDGMAPDILIHADQWATVWRFEPVTERARDFIEENVHIPDELLWGEGFVLDHRPARQLAIEMSRSGLVLFNPQFGYFAKR
jgi:hypothetical protein